MARVTCQLASSEYPLGLPATLPGTGGSGCSSGAMGVVSSVPGGYRTQVIHDNSGIMTAGLTGTSSRMRVSGRLTMRQFARGMSLDDALDPRNLLLLGMNGESLPEKNGFPIGLIAPGWYGVANVKWLTRIEDCPQSAPCGTTWRETT